MISKETWHQAQKGEINHHVGNFDLNEQSKSHYNDVYKNVFKFVDPNFAFDVKNKKILEIGPGVFAALIYCQNTTQSAIVEPMDLPENVRQFYESRGIKIFKNAVEDLEFEQYDEVWVFNVMQHIWNPDVFVAKLKAISKRILFFEPIGTPLDDLHVHSYTLQDFQKYFGENVAKQYNGRSVPHFHTSNCAYGVWDKSIETSRNINKAMKIRQ